MNNILKLINNHPIRAAQIREELSKMNIIDIGDIFEHLSKEQTIQIFRLLPKDIAANVFSYIEPENQQIIVEALTDSEVGKIIEGLYSDDAADFIEEMPANVVQRVLKSITPEKREIINQLLQYPEDSVGSIMTTEYLTLREDYNLLEAIAEMRKRKIKGLHTLYVVRRDKVLVGSVSLKSILLSKEHARIADIMSPQVISAHTLDDQEKAARLFRKYDLLSLPVTDMEGRLVGIITVDDAVEIVEEEATEDFEKMAAILPFEDTYLKTGVFRHAFHRVGWLLVLLVAAILTEMIIADVEDLMLALPALVPFIPMIMDTGGNAGSQTSTLIIRSLSLEEIIFKDLFKVWWREFRVAIICGLALGLANALRVLIVSPDQLIITVIVTVTLLMVVIVAKSLGAVLPLLAKRLNLDPAVLAMPIIKTTADVIGLLIYFGVATLLMPGVV